jgi:hypothetical protein
MGCVSSASDKEAPESLKRRVLKLRVALRERDWPRDSEETKPPPEPGETGVGNMAEGVG